MKAKISDMMDHLDGISIDIRETDIASSERIKEATMKKIHDIKSMDSHRTRKFFRAGLIAAVLVVCTLLSAAAVAVFEWSGFASTSGMSKSEKEALLAEASTGTVAMVEPDGTVHYLDQNGNELFTLTAEEAAEYEIDRRRAHDQAVRESTDLVDVDTFSLLPNGITELSTNSDGQFADFALGNGYMVLLHPENADGYSLTAGDTVTITLDSNDTCILEFGLVKDGVALEGETVKAQNHEYFFEISENGVYCFYITYFSTDASSFTNCMLTISSNKPIA